MCISDYHYCFLLFNYNRQNYNYYAKDALQMRWQKQILISKYQIIITAYRLIECNGPNRIYSNKPQLKRVRKTNSINLFNPLLSCGKKNKTKKNF